MHDVGKIFWAIIVQTLLAWGFIKKSEVNRTFC